METVFETPEPIHLYVEIGRGQVAVDAGVATQSTVEVTGERADEVIVEQDGRTLSIIGPKQRSGFRREPALNVTVTVPTHSQLVVRTGSADIAASGTFGLTELKSGSGDVEVEAVEAAAAIETGSGDIAVGRVSEDAWIKSGSGDVRFTEAMSDATVRVGSGDVEIDHTAGSASLKSGSGDLRVNTADGDLSAATGSGDTVIHRLNRGKLSIKSGSGAVAVGIPAGVPVWTDISTSSGTLHSDLASTGAPEAGQDYVELRLKTASGDITLKQL
jgi:DUF4097 and DUF4098 domain-containing protein YvlB